MAEETTTPKEKTGDDKTKDPFFDAFSFEPEVPSESLNEMDPYPEEEEILSEREKVLQGRSMLDIVDMAEKGDIPPETSEEEPNDNEPDPGPEKKTGEEDTPSEDPPEEKKKPDVKVKVKPPEKQPGNLFQPQKESPTPPVKTPPAPPSKEKSEDSRFSTLEKDDREFVGNLSEIEQHYVEFAQYADGHKYGKKGYLKEYIEFIREEKKLIAKLAADEDSDIAVENRQEYREFVKANKPHLSSAHMEVIRDEWNADRSAKKVRAEMEAEYSPLREELAELKTRPKIQAETQNFSSGLMKTFREKPKDDETDSPLMEMLAVYDEKGEEGLREAYSENEITVLATVYGNTMKMAEEMIAIASKVKDFDENNPVHNDLGQKIEAFDQEMLTDPKWKDQQIQNGRQFIPRSRIREIPANELHKYWWFNNQQILLILQSDARRIANQSISAIREKEAARFKKLYGVTPEEFRAKQTKGSTETDETETGKETPPPKEEAPDIPESPKSRVSRGPGSHTVDDKPKEKSFLEDLTF